jgi:hypothetical protein
MNAAFVALMMGLIMVAAVGCACCDAPKGEPKQGAASATPPPAAPAPDGHADAGAGEGRILGLQAGWELAPGATYSAVQSAGEVTLTVKGESPTAGYEVKLVMSPLRIYPPQWMLAQKRPDGIVAQVITPFEATASFKAADPVRAVRVSDAAGKHDVPVSQK